MSVLDQALVTGLPDLCADIIAFGLALRNSEEPPGGASEVRDRAHALFANLDRRAQAQATEAADILLAKYALVAFLDEIILGSHWDMRSDWAARPLQLEYFNEFTAGEGFYDRLETLKGAANPKKIEVLEVYALCLGLGFRGRYVDLAGQEKLKILMQDVNRHILTQREMTDLQLSDQWQVESNLPAQVKNLPVWVVAAVCAGFLLCLFLLLNLLLGSQVDSFNDQMDAFRGS